MTTGDSFADACEQLGKVLARGIMQVGDEPGHPATRVQFKSGRWTVTGEHERDNGGLCENALAKAIATLLRNADWRTAEFGGDDSMIRLPDGSWINPRYVQMIEAFNGGDHRNIGHYAPRVIVHVQGDRRVYNTETFEAACELRDCLAEKISKLGAMIP